MLDCGSGDGFVTLTGFDGRQTRVRGRDVIVVEWVPDGPDRTPPATVQGGRFDDDHVRGLQGEGVESPGTAFLRRVTGSHGSIGGGHR